MLIRLLLLLLDMLQTIYIARHPEKFEEMNPILGRHPKVAAVVVYFLAWCGAVWYVETNYTHPLLELGLLVLVVVELVCVIHNWRNKVKFW